MARVDPGIQRAYEMSRKVDRLRLIELGEQIENLLDAGALHQAIALNDETRMLLNRVIEWDAKFDVVREPGA